MGGRKGGGKRSAKPKVQYRVVQQSYEDKDYELAPKPVLVPVTSKRKSAAQPMCIFDDDLGMEDFTNRRNMLMVTDKNRQDIFGDYDVGLFDTDSDDDEGGDRDHPRKRNPAAAHSTGKSTAAAQHAAAAPVATASQVRGGMAVKTVEGSADDGQGMDGDDDWEDMDDEEEAPPPTRKAFTAAGSAKKATKSVTIRAPADDDDDDDGEGGEESAEAAERRIAKERAERVEFDEKFIQELMFGDAPGDEQPEAVADDEYPQHDATEKGAMERQFDRMMREFDMDADLDETDARAHGPLNVEDYAPALEEFVEEHAGTDALTEQPMRHKGLLNQLKHMSRQHRIFDSDQHGTFVTQLDKGQRMVDQYVADTKALKEETLQQLRSGALTAEGGLQPILVRKGQTSGNGPNPFAIAEADDAAAVSKPLSAQMYGQTSKLVDGPQEALPVGNPNKGEDDVAAPMSSLAGATTTVTVKLRRRDIDVPLDCMSVRTGTTKYNHPNVICPDAASRIPLTVGAALAKSRQQRAKRDASGLGASTAPSHHHAAGRDQPPIDDDDEDDGGEAVAQQHDDDDDLSSLGDPVDERPIDLSIRPENESAEERRMRRKLVKELQALRRQEKKQVKTVYSKIGIAQAVAAPKAKQDKAQIPLSVVRGVIGAK